MANKNANLNRQNNMTPPSARPADVAENVANESTGSSLNPFAYATIVEGTVIRSGVGTYDAVVKTSKTHELNCISLQRCLASLKPGYGAYEATLYPEGTMVLVFPASPNLGIILGARPIIVTEMMLKQNDINYISPVIQPEGGIGMQTDDINQDIRIQSNNIRPIDIVPGNTMIGNDQLISAGLLNLMYLIKASELAKMEFFTLDDLIRIVSRNFQHQTGVWQKIVYSDYGFGTEEMVGSPYWFDMVGVKDFGVSTMSDDKHDPEKELNMAVKQEVEGLQCRARIRSYTGFMGGIYNFFIAVPDPNANHTTYDSKQVDRGVLHAHVDGAGQVMVRSAGGILLERRDRIQIPKKLKESWDPSGDKVEDSNPFELRKMFKWNEQYAYGRHLELRDATAWFIRSSYQRFMELKKDWFIPLEESIVELPPKIYEKSDGKDMAEEDLERYKDARSVFHMDKDGGIVIRGGHGEELRFAGGNIILTCPGQIEIRSGKSTAVLAGHDAIIKGRESVDISATNKDLRLKGEKNTQIYCQGGILIESGSKSDNPVYKDIKGEDVISTGIVLKAPDSRIYQWGNTVHLSFAQQCLLESYRANNGIIQLMSNTIQSTVTDSFHINSKNSGVRVTAYDAVIYGKNVYCFGKDTTGIFRGDKYQAPVSEVATDVNPYSDIHSATLKIYNELWDDGKKDALLGPYSKDNRKDIRFTFRTVQQYGTIMPSEVERGGSVFVLYESSWSLLLKSKAITVDGSPVEWKELGLNDTFPWPGKERYDEPCLVTMSKEKNAQGIYSKSLDKIENESGELKPVSLHTLTVLQQ